MDLWRDHDSDYLHTAIGDTMYVRTSCTRCSNADYQDLKLHALEHTVFDDLTHAYRYSVENIEIADTISEEEMAARIMRELRGILRDGIEISELCKTIQECFGVAAKYCCDIIQRIKYEAGMYCPDRKHLY